MVALAVPSVRSTARIVVSSRSRPRAGWPLGRVATVTAALAPRRRTGAAAHGGPAALVVEIEGLAVGLVNLGHLRPAVGVSEQREVAAVRRPGAGLVLVAAEDVVVAAVGRDDVEAGTAGKVGRGA